MKLFDDTGPGMTRVWLEGMRRMTPEQHSERGFALCDFGREVMTSGVRERHPEYTERQVRLAVCLLMYGREFFETMFPGERIDP